jgi:hypothetical protein
MGQVFPHNEEGIHARFRPVKKDVVKLLRAFPESLKTVIRDI